MSTDFPSELRRRRVDADILERARSMRREAAPTERILWFCLRDRRLGGFKFRRQVGIGRYIADFYCAECRLIVETDGTSHLDQATYDERRTERLREQGYAVVRYANQDVLENLGAVLEALLKDCQIKARHSQADGSNSPSGAAG